MVQLRLRTKFLLSLLLLSSTVTCGRLWMVAFFYGHKLIASTVSLGQQPDLLQPMPAPSDLAATSPTELRLGVCWPY